MGEYLEFRNISKSFPGVKALDGISFRAEGGQCLALIGENGAGKSTLLKIMSGDLRGDEGSVILNGEEMHFTSPHDAIQRGISVIYQERQLMPYLSVMENIFSGEMPTNKLGIVDYKKMKKEAQSIIDLFGLNIDPTAPVGSLSTAYQQMVEIMKAYRRDSKVIAFDEPTAPLADTEIQVLFKLIEGLKKAGKIVIYISHRLAELFVVSEQIVVMKDGKLVKTMKTSESSEPELIKAMVGRDIGDTYSGLKRNDKQGDVLLEVKNLVSYDVKDVSFQLHAGEVLGFAGLVGAGRTEVMRAVFGADPILSGEIYLEGKKVKFKEPKDAIKAGIALCPEDRKDQGLELWRSIKDNVCMPVLAKLKKGLFLDRNACKELADEAVAQYSIKTPTVEKATVELSGGNQQKVILGRWTSSKMDTKVLILDEPTKGIDVGTKAEIYQVVCDFAKQGIGVIFISSELTEVINVADRIIVMHNGHITGEIMREQATEENVLAMAMLD
ncbi:MAG: sugar ABC transporter ATP-binding protein [Oscillospiraceae bacterium]|nr:sugar ABC transporter ATP-binding protein [Oscillospiraceae bacterium]